MRDSTDNRGGARPLWRLRTDSKLWAKVAALWHRERAREQYIDAGFESHVARKRANDEALGIARRHGWRGDLGTLKAEMSDLLDPKLRHRVGPQGGSTIYWEEMASRDLEKLLASAPARLTRGLIGWLHEEVALRGRFVGQVGLYKLAFVVGFIPPPEFMERRSAFISALTEVGHDDDYCDPALFRPLLRTLRSYTRRPFEARVGFSMPEREDRVSTRSGLLGRLRRRPSVRREP